MTHEEEQDLLTEMGMIRNKMTTLKAVHACKMRAINKKATDSIIALEMGAPRVAVAIERTCDIIKITNQINI